MRYILSQRIFALGDDFRIKYEDGRDAFVVDGKLWSIGDKLSLQDLAGNELAVIRQRLITLSPTYEIYRGDQLYATVKKALFTLFRASFAIDVPGPDDLEAQGDFLDHEYSFRRGGREVAHVSKRWLSFADTYGVEIADGEDDLLILACAVVIDLVAHDQRDRHD